MKQLDTSGVVKALRLELELMGIKSSARSTNDSVNLMVDGQTIKTLNLIKKMSEKYIRSLSTDVNTPKTEYFTVRNFKRPR